MKPGRKNRADENNQLQGVMAGEKSIDSSLRGSLYQLCGDDSTCTSHWNEVADY